MANFKNLWIARFETRDGEHEYYLDFFITATKIDEASKIAHNFLRTFYGDEEGDTELVDPNNPDGAVESPNDYISAKVGSILKVRSLADIKQIVGCIN